MIAEKSILEGVYILSFLIIFFSGREEKTGDSCTSPTLSIFLKLCLKKVQESRKGCELPDL